MSTLRSLPLYTSFTQPSVIQLAKYSGFSPIIATTSLKHADYLKTIGTTHIIDRNAHLAEEVKKVTDEPITIVLDAISVADTQQAGVEILAVGGTLITVLPPTVKAEDKEIISIVGSSALHPELLTSLYGKEIFGFLERGVIKVCPIAMVGWQFTHESHLPAKPFRGYRRSRSYS